MKNLLANNVMNKQIDIMCFGEVLWDTFPDARRVGGAPLNICLRLNALGIPAKIISSIGKDMLGEELLTFINKRGVSTEYLQQHASKPTSEVRVNLDEQGTASYEIVANTAWDAIELAPELVSAVSKADIFVYGSLVGREQISFNTLKSLLDVAKLKIFDVNLRAPHYNQKTLEELMQRADFIKLNDDELFEISEMLGSPYHTLEQHLSYLAQYTNTQLLCVTKGADGALLRINDKTFENRGFKVKVVDTVGAGDNFLAALIYQLCINSDPQYAIDFACAVGSLVAQSSGATPDITIEDIARLMGNA